MASKGFWFRLGMKAAEQGKCVSHVDKQVGPIQCAAREAWLRGFDYATQKAKGQSCKTN